MPNAVEQLVGQLIIAGFRGKTADQNSEIAKYINDYNIAGVILYDEDLEIGGLGSRNIESPGQVKNLVTQLKTLAKKPLLISVDQEGGQVHRLKSDYGFEETPSWNHIGRLNNSLMTKQFSDNISSTLSDAGINVNFTPVLDIDHGTGTVISDSERAFSSDPKTVIEHSRILINAHKEKGIITSGKHFPGLGSATGDTHEGYTDISETWSVKDLLPFDELIQSGDLDMVMVSHAFDNKLDPEYPASLSKKIISGMLRSDLGFSGVVICDDPSMRAISDQYSLKNTFELMLNAGIDLFCLGNNLIYDPDYIPKSISAICDLIDSGKITKERIKESINRIDAIKMKYNIYG